MDVLAEIRNLHDVLARMADRLQEARSEAAVLDARLADIERRLTVLEKAKCRQSETLTTVARDVLVLEQRLVGARSVLRDWIPWALSLVAAAAAAASWILGHHHDIAPGP